MTKLKTSRAVGPFEPTYAHLDGWLCLQVAPGIWKRVDDKQAIQKALAWTGEEWAAHQVRTERRNRMWRIALPLYLESQEDFVWLLNAFPAFLDNAPGPNQSQTPARPGVKRRRIPTPPNRPRIDFQMALLRLRSAGFSIAYIAKLLKLPPTTLRTYINVGAAPTYETGRSIVRIYHLVFDNEFLPEIEPTAV